MQTNIVLTLALGICFHAGLVISEFSVSDENAVRNNTALAPGYNALIRPAATTEVNIGLSLFSVDELDLNNHIFGASGWMIVKWMDARLAWDPATYGGIKTIVVPRIHIWKPDLALDSLFEDHNAFTDDSSNVRYDYTGKVVWQQWRNFKLYCKIGKDYFPYEKQTCKLDVVGSSYDISEVNLGFLSTAIDIENIRVAADYKVTETGKISSTVAVKVDNETSFEYPKLELRITIGLGTNAVRNNTVLASGYNPLNRPANTTEVNIGISLTSIDDMDLNNQIVGASGWMIVKWMDERLAWDPTTHGGIKSRIVPRIRIWKPDLALESLFEDHNAFTDDGSNVRYDYTGMVMWKQRRNFKLYCNIRKYYSPKEEQLCEMDVVGSSYNISEVSLRFLAPAVDTKKIREAESFTVTGTGNFSSTVVDTFDNETFEYPKLRFGIRLVRVYPYVEWIFHAPLIITMLLMPLTFLIPFESGEKLSYILGLYISLTYMVTMLPNELPQRYINEKLLYLFPAFAMLIGAEALLMTVLLHRAYHQKDSNEISSYLNHSWIVRFGRLSCSLNAKYKLLEIMRAAHPSWNRINPMSSIALVQITNTETSSHIECSTETEDKHTKYLIMAKQFLMDAIVFSERIMYCILVVQYCLFFFVWYVRIIMFSKP